MKFSYTLIKKLVPGLKTKAELINALTMHAYEAEDGEGDTFEVAVPPNRYTDSSSHWGLAREAAAILGFSPPNIPLMKLNETRMYPKTDSLKFNVHISEKRLCPRYIAGYFENVEVKTSPKWMQKILTDCGLRPINNVVDIMNYVMLETGQPLHAFDADKVKGGIVVRRANQGESITTLDGVRYKLTKDMLVIADAKQPLAIAGVKGGRGSEVTSNTRQIIVEAANFDSVSIYQTSKALNLKTDASNRFSHGIHPVLAGIGMTRAAELLKKEAKAELRGISDSLKKSFPRRLLKFDLNEFNHFIGSTLDQRTAFRYLRLLGFKCQGELVEIPVWRPDVETHEDLAEEVARLYGYNKLKARPPQVVLRAAETEEKILFKDKIRKILTAFGIDEVYYYSFISEKDLKNSGFFQGSIEVQNPISNEWTRLRPSLLPGLIRVISDNTKNFEAVRIFEVGRVFRWNKNKVEEKNSLAVAFAFKKEESIFELKGAVEELLKALGVVDFTFRPIGSFLNLVVDGEPIGWLGKSKNSSVDRHLSLFEVNLDKLLIHVEGEKEFKPLPKYPSVIRDISILVGAAVKIGDVIQEVQLTNQHLIEDVDLIDEYRDPAWRGRQSITLRIVFQSDEKTLTGAEVDREMEKITARLEDKFGASVR